jgi:hypothetical protein
MFMRHLIRHTTRALVALAIIGLPTVAIGQTAGATTTAQPNPAAEHLSAARRSLNKVLNAPAPSGEAFKRLTELKTEYLALERAASTASPEWASRYAAIEKIVTELIGAPSGSREAGAVGTSGGATSSKGLDPGIAANLQEFRTHLAAFSAAMSPAAPAPATTPAPAPTQAAASTATSVTTTPPPSAPTSSPASTPAATTDASLMTQVDQVIALVDAALAANAQPAGATISINRSTLEQMKAQLEQIKLQVKKPNP